VHSVQRASAMMWQQAAGEAAVEMLMQARGLGGRLAHLALMRWLRSRLVCALVDAMAL